MVAVAVALLYFSTAAALLLLLHRFVTALSRGAAIALLLLPLCFTGRAMLTGRVYAPVDLPYGAEPLQSYRSDFHIGEPHDALLSDVAYQIIPWREAMRRSILAGEWPLWNRFMLGGHPETNLHVVTIGVAYGIFEMWRQRRLVRPVIAASIGGVLALLICAIALLPFLDALPQTMEYLVRTMYAHSALRANLWPFI